MACPECRGKRWCPRCYPVVRDNRVEGDVTVGIYVDSSVEHIVTGNVVVESGPGEGILLGDEMEGE